MSELKVRPSPNGAYFGRYVSAVLAFFGIVASTGLDQRWRFVFAPLGSQPRESEWPTGLAEFAEWIVGHS
jgi:hypothetical protein